MKTNPTFDLDLYPPFAGFPRESIAFFKKLKKNNNRGWFNDHKSEYEEFIKVPMQSFIASLREPLANIAPEMDAHPKRSMFRIYRDTRFSNNKTPYKTNMAAVFHPKGQWQNSAGFYVHIEPSAIYVGGGMYMPDGNQVKLIRQAIAGRGKEFQSIVGSKVFKKRFDSLEGEKLKRAPLGYPPDHPMIEWLKYKSFYTGVEWKDEECYSPKFLAKVADVYKDLVPLVRFLNEGLGAS